MWHLFTRAEGRVGTVPPDGNDHISIEGRDEVLVEDVLEYAFGCRLESLRCLACSVGHPKTVQLYTTFLLSATSPAAGISFLETQRDVMERHQLMIACETMDFFSERLFEGYIANF